MSLKLNNFILFQTAWISCVIAGGSVWHWFGTLVIGVVVAMQLVQADLPQMEIRLIAIALMIGMIWDSLLVMMGLTQYQYGQLLPGFAPHWIIALWALFACTMNLSLRWLKPRLLMAALLGAVGGPLAYYAGQKLGAVTFGHTQTTLIALAIGWGVFTPMLAYLSRKYDGFPSLDEQNVMGQKAS